MAFRSAEALVHMMTTGAEPEWFPKCLRLARAWDKDTPRIGSWKANPKAKT